VSYEDADERYLRGVFESGFAAGAAQHSATIAAIAAEVDRARGMHAPMCSAHHAYAVILEELDEFKAEVWKCRSARDPQAMRAELIQLAAMCVRAIEDLQLAEETT